MEKFVNVQYEPYIETASGRKFHFLDPNPDDIDINDIAHALSNICRFTGHTKRYYSVGQHSIHVASLLPPSLQMWGLLHDASEAYVADLASPIKPYLQSYKDLEQRIMNAVAKKFGLPEGFHKQLQIVHADLQMLKKEAFELMTSKGSDWATKIQDVRMPDVWLPDMSPARAKGEFLLAYELLKLKNGTNNSRN